MMQGPIGKASMVRRQDGTVLAKLAPGDYFVTRENVQIMTVLGSCVAACIRNPETGTGGMNHFMLPVGCEQRADDWGGGAGALNRFGNFAMETLINTVLSFGGTKSSLEIKLFGGGRVLDISADVGATNVDFVMSFLKTEQLSVLSMDVGQDYARKVIYEPTTGRARMKKLRDIYNGYVAEAEKRLLSDVQQAPVAGDVELF